MEKLVVSGAHKTTRSGTDAARRAEFEELLQPHLDLLFGFALRLTRHRADAEDLLQDALYRAYRGLDGFERGTNFKAWMFRILTNAFISRRRSDARAPILMDIDAADTGDRATSDEVAADVKLGEELEDASTDWGKIYSDHVEDDVKRALDELPVEFRVPLLLSGLGGLRYQEIADVLRIPIGTVMSRLFRARQRLRRALRQYALDRGIPVALEEES
jgi:RNA polymerase sigma-70 factor, ECF subfamily